MSQEPHLLRNLDSALNNYKHTLKKAAQTIIDEGVSKYPIFVAHQQQINIGMQLIDREKHNSPFSFSASTLEEFVTKKLVDPYKVENFKQVYKKSGDSLCFFVLEAENFVFAPCGSGV